MINNYSDFELLKVEWINQCTEVFSDYLFYRGCDLRPVFKRYLWMLVQDESLLFKHSTCTTISHYISALNDFTCNRLSLKTRFLFSISNIGFVSYLYRSLFRFIHFFDKTSSSNQPHFVCHHSKHLKYLINSGLFTSFRPHLITYDRPLDSSDIDFISDKFIFLLFPSFAHNTGIFVVDFIRSLLDRAFFLFDSINPSSLIYVEGDAAYQECLAIVGRTLSIPCITFQWGILLRNKLSIAFSNSSSSTILTWGDFFSRQYKSCNPLPSIISFGRCSSIQPSIASIEQRRTKVLFISQSSTAYITPSIQSSFIRLASSLSKQLVNYEVCWRPHPSGTLHLDQVRELDLSGVTILDCNIPIEYQLNESIVSISIWSSALIDSILYNCIPILLSISSFTDYPFDFVAHSAGLEFNNTDDALYGIPRFLDSPDLIASYSKNLQLIKPSLNSLLPVSSKNKIIHSLI